MEKEVPFLLLLQKLGIEIEESNVVCPTNVKFPGNPPSYAHTNYDHV